MVDRLAKKGMPTSSVEAARVWRAANLRGHMTKGSRITDVAPADAAVDRVHRLWPVARAALAADRFDLVETEMRAALRAVPLGARPKVQLDAAVMDRLTQHVFDAIAGAGAPGGTEPVSMADAAAEEMGTFWFAVAAGEYRIST